MTKETPEEMLSRVEAMAGEGTGTWDLSPNDIVALRHVLDELAQVKAERDEAKSGSKVFEDTLDYLWGKLYDGKTDWEYSGQVANHALAAIDEERGRADAALAREAKLRETLIDIRDECSFSKEHCCEGCFYCRTAKAIDAALQPEPEGTP